MGLSINLFWNVSEASNQIFWVTAYFYQVPKCQIWSRNTKPFFGKVRQTLKVSKSFSPFGVTNKLVLKVANSVKSVNYVLKYINLSANIKPFLSCEIDANLETLLLSWSLFSYVRITYKLFLKCFNSLKWIF